MFSKNLRSFLYLSCLAVACANPQNSFASDCELGLYPGDRNPTRSIAEASSADAHAPLVVCLEGYSGRLLINTPDVHLMGNQEVDSLELILLRADNAIVEGIYQNPNQGSSSIIVSQSQNVELSYMELHGAQREAIYVDSQSSISKIDNVVISSSKGMLLRGDVEEITDVEIHSYFGAAIKADGGARIGKIWNSSLRGSTGIELRNGHIENIYDLEISQSGHGIVLGNEYRKESRMLTVYGSSIDNIWSLYLERVRIGIFLDVSRPQDPNASNIRLINALYLRQSGGLAIRSGSKIGSIYNFDADALSYPIYAEDSYSITLIYGFNFSADFGRVPLTEHTERPVRYAACGAAPFAEDADLQNFAQHLIGVNDSHAACSRL